MGKQLSVIESSQIEWVPVDSLQKIFMKKEPLSCPRVYELSGMEGETVSFQMAYRYRKPYYSSQMMVQATKRTGTRAGAGRHPGEDPKSGLRSVRLSGIWRIRFGLSDH